MIAVLLAAAVVASQDAPQAAGGRVFSATRTQVAEKKLVCKKENATGSRVTKRRTCMTVKDWQRVQDATRDDLDVLIRKNTGAASPAG